MSKVRRHKILYNILVLIFTGHLGLLRCSNLYNINASLWQKKEKLSSYY